MLKLFAAWAGDIKLAKQLIVWGKEQVQLNTKWFNFAGFGNCETWHDIVGEMIENPWKLREQCSKHIIECGIEDVPYQDFVDAPYQEGSTVPPFDRGQPHNGM